nr:uncharacterized protein LOC124810403 isoform X6 [Hydra vulgaris]XP_047131200.1 uncharacterized protein LOC124810403 isoform X6 [Hydra vulgaris]XP_047131201.1 uncharacterized protein LOC124810403 isoform X6 [Hydra vulgaris]XP_047131202.1 uncharacterized protein LOC124810403 isoform X6 [Hydra vulgaris]
MSYAIVSFDESNETDFLPLNWIADGTLMSDIPMRIKKHHIVEFYWPPLKNPESISKAKSRCLEADLNWPTYKARILSTADSLYEARQKAILAEDTSNLEVENSIKQRRINIIQADESDKSEVESDCSEEFIEKKKKVIDVHKKMKHVEKSYSLPKPKSPIQIIPKPVPPSFLSVKRSDSFNQSDWNDCDIEITRHNTTVLENKTYMPTFDSSANFASTSQTNTILTAILTQIEDIKQTLKVHSAILQSLVQQDRGINASLCQLPEDIKLPILTYEDLLVMDQKLIDPLVKKYGSVKVNATTLDANKKQIEAELSKWFTNSRDRGSDRRGRKKRLKDINNESDFIFNK